MDLITQGLLGATVAQAGFQRKLGRRALVWGALVGMLPDADVFVKLLSSNPFAEILYHRGFTHSIWFGPLMGPLLGYLVYRWYRSEGRKDSLSTWIGLMIWCLLTHPLLDVFTIYGTQLLAPLSSHRFMIPAISVIDPIYSGILLISIFIGIFCWERQNLVTTAAAAALSLTSGYVYWGLEQNEKAEKLATLSLCADKATDFSVNAYPGMFQLFLRRVVVEEEKQIRIGFVSTWSPKPIQWATLKRPTNLPGKAFLQDSEVAIYKWFTSDHYFTVYQPEIHKVMLIDTRFGFKGLSLVGIWGIRFDINDKGEKITSAEHFRVSLGEISAKTILEIFQETFV